MPRIEKRLPIVNKLGLHARAAVKLVQLTAISSYLPRSSATSCGSRATGRLSTQ